MSAVPVWLWLLLAGSVLLNAGLTMGLINILRVYFIAWRQLAVRSTELAQARSDLEELQWDWAAEASVLDRRYQSLLNEHLRSRSDHGKLH